MSDKLLAEWFWTDRWMGSSGFLLPLEARGLYREMLTQAWRRGARLPNDPQAIQRACGVTADEWGRSWGLVARFWREDGDSLVNDTQVQVYNDARAAALKASNRARSAAQALHKQRSSSAQAEPEHCPPSPSPSPSLRIERKNVSPPAYLPPGQLAETETDARIRTLQLELGSKIELLANHPNSRQMVPEWSREVTSYKGPDGKQHRGQPDYRVIRSIDRLENSITDADWWLEELNKRVYPEVAVGAR